MDLLDIKRVRKDLGLTQIQFSKEIGVQQPFLSRVENGLDRMPKYFIERIKELYPDFKLSNYFQTKSLNTFYRFKNDYNIKYKPVPIYEIGALSTAINVFSDNKLVAPIDYLMIPKLPIADGAIFMHDDSMCPEVKSGDLIVYNIVKNFPDLFIWGEMYILYFDFDGDQILTVKTVQQGSTHMYIKLISENKKYADKEFSMKHLKAVALVKAIINFRTTI